MLFKGRWKLCKRYYSSNISFGEFTITIYNGIDWNTYDVVNEDWDENVNLLTCLLERKNSKGAE